MLAAGALTLGLALIVNRPTTDAEMDRFEAWAAAVNRGDAHLQLHAVERQPRDLQAAIAAYGEARRIRPEGLQPLKQLPAAYFRQGDPQAAGAIQEELVGRLREEWPRNRLVRGRELATLAQLAVRAGDGPRAERAAREWRSLEPESLGALDALVTSFILQQRGPQAVALAEERYRRVPDAEGEELLRRARALP